VKVDEKTGMGADFREIKRADPFFEDQPVFMVSVLPATYFFPDLTSFIS